MPSWFSRTSSPPSPALQEAPPPAPPAPTPPPPPPVTQAPSPSRPPVRQAVNPNAPAYILTFGGAAFVLGLAISVKQVRKLRGTANEIARAATLAEVPAQGVASAVPPRVGRTRSILSQGGRTGGVLEDGFGERIEGARPVDRLPATSLPPAPPTVIEASSTPATRKPLFPPSARRAFPAIAVPASPAPTSGSTSPNPTLFQMLRERDAPHPADGPVEEVPPVTPRTVLYAFGAFGVATVLALGVVAVPVVSLAYWLGVEKPSEFPVLFRLKIAELLPSLGPSILRPSPSATSPSSASTDSPLPPYLQHGKDSPNLPSFLQQGSEDEGELEEGVYAWFERVRAEFERERREEVERRRLEEMERDLAVKAAEEIRSM